MFLTLRHIMLCACVASQVLAELFTSMAHMQKALEAERDIALVIRQYVRIQEEKLKNLERIANEIDQHSARALENPEYYLANPVNAYLFVKYFTLDWDRDIDPVLKNNTSNTGVLSKTIELHRQDLPTYEDLTGTVNALLRLQDTYKLDTSSIARGDLGGSSSSQLSAEECFEIGRQSYKNEDFYHTVMWMQEALDRNFIETNQTVSRSLILDYLTYSTYKQGNIRHALVLTKELLLLEPDHSRAQSNKLYYEKILLEEEQSQANRHGDEGDIPIQNKRQLDDYRNSEEFVIYERLCRGEKTQEYMYQHKLVCRYRDNKNPLLILQPVKEEEVYLDPWLVIYHDVISDREINIIKQLAVPKLGRATVHNVVTGKLEIANYRISKSAWLRAEDHPVIDRLNKRIQAITGLDVETAEELQIANYGIAGHYEPHFDFARKEEKDAFRDLGTGNRIATWLTYMTSVEAGGATVFPYIGVKLFPIKGAAAFWYNLYRSGEGIYNTRHAACPVLVGTKWVSNKWIHERGQEFRRPCGLNSDE
ncbi:hypothetical protein CHS0354_028800 [Potamilus streckersoni]|uniref:procollagen-proline 4-dioxygenase n=1 Tax=Potamilus streckersoni TaxID=2493646 RepID=A0AAE0SWC1_9BIVA|nr:hypothetical protein CHS0354_028800 [Potamilus streckersoni]